MSKYKVERFFNTSDFETTLNDPTDYRRRGYELHSWSSDERGCIISVWVKCELPFQRIKLVDPAK
jgi:hypothetical protein